VPTTQVYLNAGTDDGAYTASALTTTRSTENWNNGSQFWRFQFVAVPQASRRVIVSATLSLTPSGTTRETTTTTITAQPGASGAITSGADATARPRTTDTASHTWDATTSGTEIADVTAPVREALEAPSWTPGSALTLFAVRTATTGGGWFIGPFTFYTRDHSTAPATVKPILTINYQPAGSSAGTAAITGARSAAKNARGAVSGSVRLTGIRQGRKGGRGTRTGSVALTGAITGRATRRASSIRVATITGARTGRTARRGALTGIARILAAFVVRPTRTGRVTGTAAAAGTVGGRAGRRVTLTHTVGLTGSAQVTTLRAGTAGSGSTALTGVRRGESRRHGRTLGPVVFTGARTGRPARGGAVAGGLSGAGVARGRRGGSGRAEGTPRYTGVASGRARHATRITGALDVAGANTATRAQAEDIAFLVPLRSSFTQTAHTTRGGGFAVTTRLNVRGFLANVDTRAGIVEGDLRIGGHAEDGVTGRKGSLADPAHRVRVLGANRRGLAGRAGVTAKWLPSLAVTTTGQATRSGALTGQLGEIDATSTGLTGRSGEAQGRASLIPGEGAGTLTGQAGRGGVSVSTSGAPTGLTAAAPARVGGYAWYTRLYTRYVHGVRTERRSSIHGTVALSGAVSTTATRAASATGHAARLGGRVNVNPHRTGATAGQTAITGRFTASRSDAAVPEPGTLSIGGAVRGGVHREGGQVSGSLRFLGDLAAATTKQGGATGTPAAKTIGVGAGRHGGQGTTRGGFRIQGAVQVPVDFSGGVAGAATLRGRFTYTTRAPLEVRHTIVRTPARARPTIVATPPQLVTSVKTTTPRRGTVLRG